LTRAAGVAAVLLLCGCGAAPPEQEAAADAVARTARSDDAECTGRSRNWVAEGPPAEVFVCAVRADDGFCDQYRVDRDGARFRVRLLERRGSCVLPVG
jgi:hypothetical protein